MEPDSYSVILRSKRKVGEQFGGGGGGGVPWRGRGKRGVFHEDYGIPVLHSRKREERKRHLRGREKKRRVFWRPSIPWIGVTLFFQNTVFFERGFFLARFFFFARARVCQIEEVINVESLETNESALEKV